PRAAQLGSTYGLRPTSPGRQRVSYRWRIASAGGGPGAYGRPAPPNKTAPSPNCHSTLGSALTLTRSPRNAIDSTSRCGAGASQNHESAPVRPPRLAPGLAPILPGNNSSRAAIAAAIAAGFRPRATAPAPDVTV